MSNYIPLYDYAANMGINKGDIVFISSDSRIMLYDAMRNKSQINLNRFIDGLINVIGSEGTLIFPTYNWGFCKGEAFNYLKTRSETGSIGTMALSRSDFKRTKHPIYSMAVYGKYQSYLVKMSNTDSFGIDSPFNFLNEYNAINFIIDVSLKHCFTFAHFVEEQAGIVKYRYIKNFTSQYIDENGIEETRTYSMFVRNLDLEVETTIDPIEEDFIVSGIEKEIEINNSKIKKIELAKSYPILLDDIIKNKSRKICHYKGQG